MAFDRAAAKAAGYTDEEIDEFLRQQSSAPAPGAEPPPPTTRIQEVSSLPAAAATTGLGLLEVAGPAAAAYGAYRVGRAVEARLGAPAAPPATPPAQAPVDLRGAMSSGAPARQIPITSTPPAAPAPTTSPILDAQGRPMVRPPVTGPVAPTPAAGGMPPLTAGEPPFRPPAQPSVLDRATTMVRQLAANRALQQGAARLGGAAALLMPSNIGQDYPFPQSGPLRGSELNPATGRPWTREELAAYRAQYGR